MKANLHKTGIYKITNIVNGRIYVGSAANGFKKRWQKHLSDLKHKRHKNTRLQNVYNKYGVYCFTFEILAFCPSEYVLKLEQYFIDTLKPYYNICKKAGNSLGVKRTEETKKKISEAKKLHKHSAEFKSMTSERLKGNTYTKGKKQKPEVVENRRQKLIGVPKSDATKQKIRQANLGRKPTDEARAKMSQSTAKYEYLIKNIKSGETHIVSNLKEFCLQRGLHDGHMHETLTGINKSTGRRAHQHKGFKIIQKALLQ